MDREFARLYPNTSNAVLAARYGRSTVTILKWARRLGLRKDESYHNAVQSSNASKRRLTAAQRNALSRRAQGRKLSPETIAKIIRTKRERGTILRGPQHPFWKGGRPWERFKDPRYVAWRNAVLERDGYQCKACGRQCRKHERGLAAHHVRPYALYPQLRLELTNGQTLCRDCHMKLHGHPLAPRPPVPCACGCGTLIPPVDIYGRARRFVNHHARRVPTSEVAPRSS